MRVCSTLAIVLLLIHPAFALDRLVVHEWGTFTSLQDESGQAVGGINEDVEPLPSFVHNLSKTKDASWLNKGLPGGMDKGVTMRLETPVVYFHTPKNSSWSLSYSVQFHGGLLSQFYPNADTGVVSTQAASISPYSIGSLTWPTVTLGDSKPGPKTDSHVWLAPRNVDAADVTAGDNESERFLFYRGVGNVNAPLKIVRPPDGTKIKIISQAEFPMSMVASVPSVSAGFNKLWYFDMRSDGKCAFTTFGPLATGVAGDAISSVDTKISDAEYSKDNLKKLRADMRAGLIAEGLFADEAEAMLSTWENAYFKSPGTRVFFLLPRTWTDQILPVHLSVDADLTRVMVGRIDLITPRHREILNKLAQGSGDFSSPEVSALLCDLGRFAKPMMRDEIAHRPSPSLEKLAGMLQ